MRPPVTPKDMKNPQKDFIQPILGRLDAVVIMPTFGSHSWKFRGKLSLPLTITRTAKETPEHFSKKREKAHATIRKQLVKIIGITDHEHLTADTLLGEDGTWDKCKYAPTKHIQHYKL